MKCYCKYPTDIIFDVCGNCLLPFPNMEHDDTGKLIKYTKPKRKKRAKNTDITRIIYELERFGRLNNEDIPLVLATLKQSR